MNHLQTAPISPTFAPIASHEANPRSEKTGLLTLDQIAQLIAEALEKQRQELEKAHSSWVYATDRDEFLDFHAHQSVNTNRSTKPA